MKGVCYIDKLTDGVKSLSNFIGLWPLGHSYVAIVPRVGFSQILVQILKSETFAHE